MASTAAPLRREQVLPSALTVPLEGLRRRRELLWRLVVNQRLNRFVVVVIPNADVWCVVYGRGNGMGLMW